MTKFYKELRDEAAAKHEQFLTPIDENNDHYSVLYISKRFGSFCSGHDHGVFESEIVKDLVEALELFIAGDFCWDACARALKAYETAKRETGK